MWLLTLLGCTPTPPNVVLVVLDTVRADRTSLCGNPRPTTPTLEALAKRGKHTCALKTPGTWTVPSHASFFTGLPLLEHQASMGPDKREVSFGVRELVTDVPTLAEDFDARGYQTLLVSANGLVSSRTGLDRGYARVDASRDRPQRGQPFVARVAENLATLDPDKPSFVTINIVDAHDPWDAIPEGHPWLPARPATKPTRLRRSMKPDQLAAPDTQARFRDHYDHALSQADTVLAGVLKALEREEVLGDGPWRLIVTSDHGEFLGEHGRLLHNGPDLYEPVVNVPLVAVTSSGQPPDLPSPASGLGVHGLVRDGTWKAELPIEAAHLRSRHANNPKIHGCEAVSFGRWLPDGTKHVCARGSVRTFDLTADPDETHPRRTKLRAVPGFSTTVGALEALNRTPATTEKANEALRALGYLED